MARRSSSPRVSRPRSESDARRRGPLRFAVVGLGWIAQAAVLPAFANTKRHAVLSALVSDDRPKLRALGRKYGVQHLYRYSEFEECLRSGEIEAVYIALPNELHAEYAIRAAKAGIHVLCEKPMAVTSDECRRMMAAARRQDVRLMLAYRLHFEPGTLRAIDLVAGGAIGDVRVFESAFSTPVTDASNIRIRDQRGAGTLYDIGIYCINAARQLLKSEPERVVATAASGNRRRFAKVEESCSASMHFPGGRLASFTCSFGAEKHSSLRLLGTKGTLVVEPAYSHASEIHLSLTVEGRTERRTFPKRDQFAPLLLHFAECVRRNVEPTPDGDQGLADVRIIEAMYRSIRLGRPISLAPFPRQSRPDGRLAHAKPPVRKPALVRAKAPAKKR